MSLVLLILFIKLFYATCVKLNKEYCGNALKPNSHPVSRVVGGYEVGFYKYPWFAALFDAQGQECGASLIGIKYVVSAAHCYKSFLSKEAVKLEDIYTVKLGIYNKCKNETRVQTFKTSRVIIHDKYKKEDPFFDVALLILDRPATSFHPICLPPPNFPKPKQGFVPGLGALRFKGNDPCTLREVRILIYETETCKKVINSAGVDVKKMTNILCAGYLQGGIDTCQGDSGGPLQAINDQGQYILLGLVSFGVKCALPNNLGVYTDVSKYLGWIKINLGLTSANQANGFKIEKNPLHYHKIL